MSDTAAVSVLTGEIVRDEQLTVISLLAEAQLKLERQIEQTEEQLSKLNEQLAAIRDTKLPDAMSEVGMSSFKLRDGAAIIIQPFYQGKIPEGRETEAFKWLRDHNFDSIIKRNVVCAFGKGQDELAAKLVKLLMKQRFEFQDKQSVHPQTMKAFIREQVEGGHNLPTDLLGVYVGKRAKVTPANK